MDRLVEVELRRIYVVLEPPLHRRPGPVDGAEGGPTVLYRLDDHPDAHEVVDLVEFLVFQDHFLVDRVEVLRPAGDLGVDPGRGQPLLDLFDHLGQVDVALGGTGGHHLLDLRVTAGVQRGESQVFQLPLHVRDAETVRQRRVDVQCFLGGALLVRLRHGRQRPHVVEAVAQFYEQDSRVFGHGDEHLAHRRRLRRGPSIERDPLQLGDPVDDLRHYGAEIGLQVGQRQRGVLDGVVQQGGRQCDVVHAEPGQNRRHRQWVRDEGLARTADLALVRPLGRLVRLQDQALVALKMTLPVRLQQRAQGLRLGLALPAPGQHALDSGNGPAPWYPFDCAHALPFICLSGCNNLTHQHVPGLPLPGHS